MDNFGAPRHGAGVDERLFRGLPTIWLQELYNRWHGLAWASVAIHGSWFVVPWVAVAAVIAKEPRRLSSLLRWWFALLLLCLPLFALFPVEPPWMADGEVIRINVTIVGAIDDNNALAAMPSLHVALPLVLAFWFFRERSRLPGLAMLAYSALVAFEVVFSGEHYVADVVGAVAVAAAVALIPRLKYQAILEWTRSRARAARMAGVPAPVLPSRARLHHRERAQALIEFALIAPLMFVILFVIVDFSIAIDRRLVLQHAVREGARYGAVHTTCDDIIQQTFDQAQDINNLTVDVSYPSGGSVGKPVKVSADFTWDFPIASELANVFGVGSLSVDMTPSGTARLEQSVDDTAGCAASS